MAWTSSKPIQQKQRVSVTASTMMSEQSREDLLPLESCNEERRLTQPALNHGSLLKPFAWGLRHSLRTCSWEYLKNVPLGRSKRPLPVSPCPRRLLLRLLVLLTGFGCRTREPHLQNGTCGEMMLCSSSHMATRLILAQHL